MPIGIRESGTCGATQRIDIADRIIGYRLNGWFLSSQLGTGEHTLRDGSQQMYEGKALNHKGIDRILQNGSFSVKSDGGEGSYVDLTKARPEVAEFRSPLCS